MTYRSPVEPSPRRSGATGPWRGRVPSPVATTQRNRSSASSELRLRPLSKSRVDDLKPLRHDVIVLRLFCVWIFLLCFYYTAIPGLRFSAGVGITPDRIACILFGLVFFSRFSSATPRNKTIRAGKFLGYMAAVFTAVSLTSWFVTGSDAGTTRFANLTWIVNLSVYPAVAFFVARSLRYDKTMLKRLLVFFAALGVYLSVTAFAEHYQIEALVFPKYILDGNVGIHWGRSRGPFVDTIANGGILVLGFSAWSALAASTSGVKRLFGLLLALFVLCAVYFTETRSVWLSLAVVTGIMLVLRTGHRMTAAAVIGTLACAFILGLGSKFSAFDDTLFSRRQKTIDYRLDNYTFAWNAFKANPAVGLGYGRFRLEWSRYADLQNARLEAGLDDGNHSTLLGILADLGLAGGIPFIAMAISAALVCWTAYRRLGDPGVAFQRHVVVVAMGTVAAFVVMGITSDLKAVPILNITTFWFVGVASSLASLHSSTPTMAASGVAPNRYGGRHRPLSAVI